MKPQEDNVSIENSRNFLAAVFDFDFNKFVTPYIVRTIYLISIISVGFHLLSGLFAAARIGFLAGLLALILAPFLFIFYISLTRVALEMVIALIRIYEHVKNLDAFTQSVTDLKGAANASHCSTSNKPTDMSSTPNPPAAPAPPPIPPKHPGGPDSQADAVPNPYGTPPAVNPQPLNPPHPNNPAAVPQPNQSQSTPPAGDLVAEPKPNLPNADGFKDALEDQTHSPDVHGTNDDATPKP